MTKNNINGILVRRTQVAGIQGVIKSSFWDSLCYTNFDPINNLILMQNLVII